MFTHLPGSPRQKSLPQCTSLLHESLHCVPTERRARSAKKRKGEETTPDERLPAPPPY